MALYNSYFLLNPISSNPLLYIYDPNEMIPIQEIMTHTFELAVPLEVEISTGNNWAELIPWETECDPLPKMQTPESLDEIRCLRYT